MDDNRSIINQTGWHRMKSASTRNLALVALSAALVASQVFPTTAQADPPKKSGPAGVADAPSQVRGDEITPQQIEAVRKGLEWLAARQKQGWIP